MADTRAISAATIAVTAGRPDRAPGQPVNTPPVLSSTYSAGGEVPYARAGNPTWSALEDVLAALEGPGCRALTFASGMAAISAVVDLVPVGGLVVAPRMVYSGTRALLTESAGAGRIRLREVTPGQLPDSVDGAAMVWVETPTNPMLDLIDIGATVSAARGQALVVVDSTFATPLGQHPLDHGADIVVHSATKYLSGHSDVLLGTALTRDAELLDRLIRKRTLGGGIPGPMEAWLALRGLRTLPLRWERACANAAEIAGRARGHRAVARVRYPGLAEHPGHGLAVRQMTAFGAIVGIELRDAEAAEQVAADTRLWLHATSLGGVESTLERRRRWAEESPDVPEGLLRLSVGIEDVEDLWADLSDALDRAMPPARTR